jgi:hypothetical protein
LLLTFRGDQQADRYGNGPENNFIFPLLERGQTPGQHDVVANDSGNRDCYRRSCTTEQRGHDD